MFCRIFTVKVFMEYVTKESQILTYLWSKIVNVLLPCYENMSLKPEIPIMSMVMLEKCSNEDVSAQKSSIIK